MRVLITGGGTGGHINPAIAIAQCFLSIDPNTELLYAGTPTGMEARLVKEAKIPFAPIKVKGFWRSFSPSAIAHNAQAAVEAVTSKKRAKEIIRDFKPDIVIGTGGYVSGPVVLAAAKAGIACGIHEQNAFPGVTNRLLAKQVDRVFLAVGEAKTHLDPHANYMVVGNPVRESVLKKSKAEARRELGLDDRILIHLCIAGQILAMIANQRIGRFLRIHRALGFIRSCCLAVIGDCQRGCHTGVEQHGRKQNARNQFLHSPTKHLSFSFLTDRISMCTGYY